MRVGDAASGAAISSNSWRSRVYAMYEDGPSPGKGAVYTLPKFCQILPYSDLHCSIPAPTETLPKGSVFVVDTLDSAVMQLAADGHVVLVLGNGTAQGSGSIGFETQASRYKTAWWLGSDSDSMMGTVFCKAETLLGLRGRVLLANLKSAHVRRRGSLEGGLRWHGARRLG